jgi:hypothetical protein
MLRILATTALVSLLACATPTQEGGPGSPVRLAAPAEVAWSVGGPFELAVEVRNDSEGEIMLARPEPEALQVRVLRDADGSVACQTPRPSWRQVEGYYGRLVRPERGLKLKVDVWPYCRSLAPGAYRYEATFLANPVSVSGQRVWSGTLLSPGGQIRVSAEAPAAAAPPAAPPSPDAARACVDRELAARGLNAYGDPADTAYPNGPPADEAGRILYVAGRNAEIRKACGIGGM